MILNSIPTTPAHRKALLDLAERCEAAESGDRMLDTLIAEAIGHPLPAMAYTTDTADSFTIVPEKCRTERAHQTGTLWTWVIRVSPNKTTASIAASAPLAISAASLRARAAYFPVREDGTPTKPALRGLALRCEAGSIEDERALLELAFSFMFRKPVDEQPDQYSWAARCLEMTATLDRQDYYKAAQLMIPRNWWLAQIVEKQPPRSWLVVLGGSANSQILARARTPGLALTAANLVAFSGLSRRMPSANK